MSIKAVVFDFDGTLVDTNTFVLKHLEKTLDKIGWKSKEESLEQAKQVLGRNLSFEKFFEEVFDTQWEEILKAYREDATETKYVARPGMLEYVNTLQKDNVSLYILSNRDNLMELRLQQAGFDPDSFKIYRAPEGHKKPDDKAYSEVINDINEKGIEEVLIIGNHPDDYLALPTDWKKQFRAFPDTEENTKEFSQIFDLGDEQIYDEIFNIS